MHKRIPGAGQQGGGKGREARVRKQNLAAVAARVVLTDSGSEMCVGMLLKSASTWCTSTHECATRHLCLDIGVNTSLCTWAQVRRVGLILKRLLVYDAFYVTLEAVQRAKVKTTPCSRFCALKRRDPPHSLQ
jgi:hypothetical protein